MAEKGAATFNGRGTLRDQRTVVFINGDEAVRSHAVKTFNDAGCQVFAFDNLKEGYRHVRWVGADLVFVEPQPEGMSVVEFSRILRSAEATRLTPLVVVADAYDERERQEGFNAGIFDFVYKPLDDEDLLGTLRNSAERHELPEAERKDRIMVVEDSPIVNRVYREIMERHRFDYQIVAEPTVAMSAIGDFMPDLILMDAQMPEIDGFELTGMIRAEKRFSNIRIIMVTSDQKTESYLRALQIGASDFITKPFNEEILLARMRVHLNNKRLYDDLATAFGELRALKNKLERLSTTDGLSGLYNHRHFYELFLAETERAKRDGSPLAFLMCDIDHFKKFNDTYGHLVGDNVIKAVADTILGVCRAYDVVARYGGEEFAVLSPETDMEGIAQLAERIRTAIEAMEVVSEGEILKVTSSGGYGVWDGNESVKDLIKRADEALYESKKGGRNRVSPG